ncbi:hypothetical protein [Streptomyces sp. NPDC002889]|uniref:hypothetical protein n=1 Tax=Streptomyces sp. NPDC002889 TaxID=3364669 RepID=UPI0036B2894B
MTTPADTLDRTTGHPTAGEPLRIVSDGPSPVPGTEHRTGEHTFVLGSHGTPATGFTL